MKYFNHTVKGLSFDKATHTYNYKGEAFYGITGLIIKWIFPNKYAAVPEQVLQVAASRGSKIHDELDNFFQDRLRGIFQFPTPEAEKVTLMVAELKSFVADTEVLVTDMMSRATAIDCVLSNSKGDISLADYKTTSELDMLYLSWQLSINAVMYEMCFNRKVHKLYAIWLPKDLSKAQMVEVERLPNEEVFRFLGHAQQNAETFETEYRPKEPTVPDYLKDAVSELVEINNKLNELEARKKELMDFITPSFLNSSDKAWKGENFSISRVAGGVRKTFDTARFKAEHGDVYDQYLKETITGETVRVKFQ